MAASLLICYDGSERAGHAIAVCGELFPGAQVHVLNVWEPMERIVARYSALGPYVGESIGEADSEISGEADAVAAAGVALAQKAGLDAKPRTAAVRTTVWETVLTVADELEVDVIVTGTRSLHGVREALSNTLSHALLQHSRRAVLAVPMPADD
ncbi:MAG TPA: universal stress protein [Solirubrobacteraceae bacterium]|jgi:nucleotide-binding universal stress UspA family protein|nr:universal stress protein [Solirubrobacteraceae bacterium]